MKVSVKISCGRLQNSSDVWKIPSRTPVLRKSVWINSGAIQSLSGPANKFMELKIAACSARLQGSLSRILKLRSEALNVSSS